MAYVIRDDQMVTKSLTSELSKVDFERQRDIYRLGKMGNAQSARLWNDFAREDPNMARLVVADVEADKQATALARKSVDKVLRKSEKGKKGKKNLSALAAKSASKPEIREHEAYLRSLLSSPDPATREAAWQALNPGR